MLVAKMHVPSVLMVLFFAGVTPETIFAAQCPCDIYAAGGTPCVSAHSTVRALYSSYNGPLYQVTRKSDKKTIDIGVISPGGIANTAVQDSFLAGKPGHITIIYDQSEKGNHLTPAPSGYWPPADTPALATDAMIKINGHTVHGVYTNGSFNSSTKDTTAKGVGYRNNNTSGLATGNQAEGMYMVCDGKHYNSACCFDYGNAGKTNIDEGPATMEAINFGNVSGWGHGSGNGPWVLNDCENGLVAGVDTVAGSKNWANNTPIIANFVTGMLKSKNTNFWAIKGCDAATGKLKTMYNGRQFPGWYPKKLSGSIILGIGGDNSHAGVGTFYEGAITIGFPADSIEDSVQANIVAAGYGQTATATIETDFAGGNEASLFTVDYSAQKGNVVIGYVVDAARKVSVRVFDLRGRPIAAIDDGVKAPGQHTRSGMPDGLMPGFMFAAYRLTALETGRRKLSWETNPGKPIDGTGEHPCLGKKSITTTCNFERN